MSVGLLMGGFDRPRFGFGLTFFPHLAADRAAAIGGHIDPGFQMIPFIRAPLVRHALPQQLLIGSYFELLRVAFQDDLITLD